MQEFMYKQIEDGSNCIMGYRGDEAEVVIPDKQCYHTVRWIVCWTFGDYLCPYS